MAHPEIRELELLAQTYDSTETAAGKTIRLPLGELALERHGMEAHVSNVRIESTLQYDALAAMTENLPGELFYTAIRNVRVEAGDHPFIDNVDGWDLYCDYWLRTGVKWDTLPSDVADPGADSLNQTQALNWNIRFNRPDMGAPYSRDGLMPLRLFDARKASKDVLQFTVASNLDGFASVNVDHLGTTNVWVHIVYLRKVRLPSPSRLYVITTSDKDAKGIEPSGRIEFVAITNRVNSTPSYINNVYTGMSNIELQVGGQTLYAGRTLVEIVRQMNARRFKRGVTSFDSAALSEFVAPLISCRVDALKSEMYRGRLRINIGTRSAHAETRFLIRETGVMTDPLVAKWLKKLGLSDQQIRETKLTMIGGPNPMKGGQLDAELDHEAYHPNLGAAIPAAKAKSK